MSRIASFLGQWNLDSGEVSLFTGECQSFGFSAMTYAHVGYITKFLWGQRRPPGDSEIEQ